MCCRNDPKYVYDIIHQFNENDWLIAYKIVLIGGYYDKYGVLTRRIVTPYRYTVVDISTQVMRSNSRARSPCANQVDIIRGVHVLTDITTAVCWKRSMISGDKKKIVKVYGRVGDLIGANTFGEAVFTNVTIDKDDLNELRSSIKLDKLP